MSLHLIGLASAAGTAPPGKTQTYQGLGDATAAYLAAGIEDRFAAAGAPVATVAIPTLDAEDAGANRIRDLGRLNALIAAEIVAAKTAGEWPLLMGGSCSHLIGVIAGLQQAYGIEQKLGLLWLDAHGDFNTPHTTLTGMLGGMPVAVAAGLAYPEWRDGAGQIAPLPTSRIVMVDVRNLDAPEEALIRATDVEIARFDAGFDPAPVFATIDRLAAEVDILYLHVDADILDASLQPNHPTAEPNGPDLATVQQVLSRAFATGNVVAFGLVSVNPNGEEGQISLASATALLEHGVREWVATGKP